NPEMERQTYPVTVFSFPARASRNRPHRGPDGALTPAERGTVLAPPFRIDRSQPRRRRAEQGDAVMNTMLRKSGTVLAMLAVMMLLAACQSTTGRTLGENID